MKKLISLISLLLVSNYSFAGNLYFQDDSYEEQPRLIVKTNKNKFIKASYKDLDSDQFGFSEIYRIEKRCRKYASNYFHSIKSTEVQLVIKNENQKKFGLLKYYAESSMDRVMTLEYDVFYSDNKCKDYSHTKIDFHIEDDVTLYLNEI